MNKQIIIFFALVLFTFSQSNLPTFAEYVVTWNKTYSTAESATRKTIYDQRVANFTALNELYNMSSAINNLTDWTTD